MQTCHGRRYMKALNFLTSMCGKKRGLLSSTFKKKFYLPATYSWITGDHARNRRRCNFSWRDQILAIMRSIGKGRLYTCTKHPNHQISLARLMMLVCSIKIKKKKLSRVVILLLLLKMQCPLSPSFVFA